MKKPKLAVIDGDIIVYKTAFWAETHDPLDIDKKVAREMKEWVPKGCDDYVVALSCSRKDNFRKKEWGKYKSNRDGMYTPEYLGDVRDYINEEYEIKTLPNLEADDILGIYASAGDGIAVTIDKDLRGVPGWHFNPNKEKKPVKISKKEAYRFFCKQWMMGDSTDCIPGLWKIGPKKADKLLDEWERKEWEANIMELYQSDKHKPRNDNGLEYPEIAIAMARCVQILSKDNYDTNTNEIKLWSPKDG